MCGGAQATVVLGHTLTSAEAARLRASGVPVMVLVATEDQLIPSGAQRALARLLGAAKVHESAAGHMGTVAELLGRVGEFARRAGAAAEEEENRQRQQRESCGAAAALRLSSKDPRLKRRGLSR